MFAPTAELGLQLCTVHIHTIITLYPAQFVRDKQMKNKCKQNERGAKKIAYSEKNG